MNLWNLLVLADEAGIILLFLLLLVLATFGHVVQSDANPCGKPKGPGICFSRLKLASDFDLQDGFVRADHKCRMRSIETEFGCSR